MRDIHPSPTTDRLTACLCHPCRDERIRALGLLFSDPLFLTELDRRERVLARKYRWLGPAVDPGDLRSAAFIRLSARLRKAPLWCEVPSDPDAWTRYMNTLTCNVFRTAARSERRRRRREGARAALGQLNAAHTACPESHACDPRADIAVLDEVSRLEAWASAAGSRGASGRDRRTFLAMQGAYAAGCSSHREVAGFTGTSHTEIRRLVARIRDALQDRECRGKAVEAARPGLTRRVPSARSGTGPAT